ncbi:hypothetical protein ST47_g8769 [Ascochyta rabiei]|uniref:Uncharacterized protein n=1 Tax=Didymella rabiei TaxID=5454 RepID=A0A162YJH1_DIDRA|nr:hypothetical protein ST47_g8769 [Ascochyta rabiei]
MGIPLGWNIVRNQAKEEDVLRVDVTGGRSPIRRRARGSRPPRGHARTAFDTDALVHASTSRLTPFTHLIHRVEHAPRLSHARTHLPPARTQLPPAPPAPPAPALRDDSRRRGGLQLRSRSTEGDGPADSERPLPALTPGFAPAGLRPLHRAAAAADERARVRRQQRERRAVEESDRPRRVPAPPRATSPRPAYARRTQVSNFFIDDNDNNNDNNDDNNNDNNNDNDNDDNDNDDNDDNDNDNENDNDNDDTPTTATHAAVSHPPLRRVGHRRIADGPLPASSLRESWSPVSTLDGLGDRERSNSVSSTSSHLPWQTFLSTVVPDPVAPTAESSFASAAASASFTASSSRASSSNSNSARSENTHLTVPSRRASPGLRARPQTNESFARACESSDEGDSTASDTEDEASANPLSRRRMRPSYFADEPPSPRRYDRGLMRLGPDEGRYATSYFSDPNFARFSGPLDGPIDGPEDVEAPTSFATVDDDAMPATTPASPLDQELRDARSLLERLARRDDVSDDFWASVGLTRSFADGVERVQERGHF